MTATTTGQRGRHLLATEETDFAVRAPGAGGAPSLTLRLPGEAPPTDDAPAAVGARPLNRRPPSWPGDPDPLGGNELWRTVTPSTMLAGLRETAAAVQLLQALDLDRLNGLRFRMATARPATGRRDRHQVPGRTFGTIGALSTLLSWPGQARVDLTVAAAGAATAALAQRRVSGHPDAALAMRWVVALAVAFPGDPMALAPLLLQVRWFDAGEEFVLPARWPSALLSGGAVAVSGAGSAEVGAGLGAASTNPLAFVTGLQPRAGRESGPPPQHELARAVQVARRLAARPPLPRHR